MHNAHNCSVPKQIHSPAILTIWMIAIYITWESLPQNRILFTVQLLWSVTFSYIFRSKCSRRKWFPSIWTRKKGDRWHCTLHTHTLSLSHVSSARFYCKFFFVVWFLLHSLVTMRLFFDFRHLRKCGEYTVMYGLIITYTKTLKTCRC